MAYILIYILRDYEMYGTSYASATLTYAFRHRE